MVRKLKSIIFDFGNVLGVWDPRRLYENLLPDARAVESFLQEVDFPAWNAEQDRGRPFSEGVALLSAQFPQHAHLIRAYHERWEESVVGAIEGTVEIVRQLAKAHYPLYILSNFSAEKFPVMRRRYPFLDLFDDIIISGEHKLIKPDAAIYHLTLRRIQRSATDCVFIDDSPPNLETARRLGFETIHYQSPPQLRGELRRIGILDASDQVAA